MPLIIDAMMFSSNSSEEDVSAPLRSTVPAYVEPHGSDEPETLFEKYSDFCFGLAFLVTAAIAAKRMSVTRSGSNTNNSNGAETTVVTAFYSLILATAILRCLYFLIPSELWQPSYTPVAVFAWDADHPGWVGYALAELTVSAGSLTLFSIFILILVYWADILKKYYNPGSRRSLPMATFLFLVLAMVAMEAINMILFLMGYFSTEGMILFNAILLAVTSLVCVTEITIFSRKFQNVLKTLGAINQVSTDSQVRRIVWITVTGNLFFLTRAALETVFAAYLAAYWYKHATVDRAFSHVWWDTYTVLKYVSELTILALMLHILQSRFSGTNDNRGGDDYQTFSSNGAPEQTSTAAYSKVPDASVDV